MIKFAVLHILFGLLCFVRLASTTDKECLKPIRPHWSRPGRKLHDGASGHGSHGKNGCQKAGGHCGSDTPSTTRIDVDLQDEQELLWASPNATDIPVVSIVIKPYPGQLIVDMERFSEDVVAAECSPSMMLQFGSRSTFDRARQAWDWVNEDIGRSFVLVSDPVMCNTGSVRDPWLVTRAVFDPNAPTIRLEATKKLWTEVAYEYSIDFGAIETRSVQKRFIDYAWSKEKPYDADLTTRWPEKLFEYVSPDVATSDLQFGINCIDCGIFGDLHFLGRIEGTVYGGVTRFDVSLIPRAVRADVNLEFLFSGSFDLSSAGATRINREFDIVDIPLPFSWNIAGILDIGPSAKLQAGVELESVKGNARITTGATISIPESSIAKLDILQGIDDPRQLVQISGWLPTLDVKPLDIDAQVTALLSAYFQITPGLDMVVFNQHGYSAGFPLKFIDLNLEVTAGNAPGGFCPGDPREYGVKGECWIGAELSAQVIEKKAAIEVPDITEKTTPLFIPEVKEKLDLKDLKGSMRPAARSLHVRDKTLVKQEFFKTDSIYRFPPWCKAFGGSNCIFEPEPEDEEWYSAEVAGANEISITNNRKRALLLSPRQRFSPRTVNFKCDSSITKVELKPYPGPSVLKFRNEAGVSIPIMRPLLRCKDTDCPVDKWDVVNDLDPKTIVIPKNPREGEWSNDHIYEANWLTSFWRYLAEDGKLTCTGVSQTLEIGKIGGYADKMLSNIGNDDTYMSMMVLIPKHENSLKHRIFAKSKLYAKYFNPSFNRACAIGRIVQTCKYMDMPETRKRLANTIDALNEVFLAMDNDRSPGIMHPEGQDDKVKFTYAHKAWFEDLYAEGIKHARDTLKDYAKYLITQKPQEFASLSEETRNSIKKINISETDADWSEFCPKSFVYPKIPVSQGGSSSSSPGGVVASASQSPPTPSAQGSTSFPPAVTPATGPKSGWQISFQQFVYLVNDFSLPEDSYVVHSGKRTVNTRCIGVGEVAFSPVTTFPQNALVTFATKINHLTLSPDTCCIGLFEGATCNPNASGVQHRLICDGVTSSPLPFEVRAWMVYGCTGLWTGIQQ